MEYGEKENKMAVMPMGRLAVTMALPLVVSLLVQSLYSIVDGIFVARISEDALTATSLAFPIQMLMISVGIGTGVGINALLSRKLGQKKYEEANEVATTGLLLAGISAAVFLVLGIFCVNLFVRWFGAEGETADMCRIYLRICMIFCEGTFFEIIVQRLLQATGKTILSMTSQLSGAIVNLILDPILIFGLFGLPSLGIVGAAVATVIGQWVGASLAIILNHTRNKEIHITFRGYRPKKDIILPIYRVGLPTMVMQAMGSIMMFAFNAILMPLSATAVAFFGVYYKLQNFIVMPINGLGQASIPIVGFNYGSKDGKRIRELLRVMLPIALVIALIGALLLLCIPRQLLHLYSASEEMLSIGVFAMRVISFTIPLMAVTTILGYVASGLANGVISMVGTALRQFVVLIPLAYLFARFGGVNQIWYSIWIAEAAAIVYTVLAFRRQFRIKVRPLMETEDAGQINT